jgi:DNA polymerase III delta prime subunit
MDWNAMSEPTLTSSSDSSRVAKRSSGQAPIFQALSNHLAVAVQHVGDPQSLHNALLELEPFHLEPELLPDAVLDLRDTFGLSLFECGVLVLAYLPARLAHAGLMLSQLNQDAHQRTVTPALALALLSDDPDTDELAFLPDAPLFRFGLMRMDADFNSAPSLLLTTRAHRYLVDANTRSYWVDQHTHVLPPVPLSKLEPLLHRALFEKPATILTQKQTALLEQLIELERNAGVLALRGGDAESRRAVLSRAGPQNLHVIPIFEDTFAPSAANLTNALQRGRGSSTLEDWACAINREARLLETAFVLEVQTTNSAVLAQVADLMQVCEARLFLSSREALNLPGVKLQHFELPSATFSDQPELWVQALSVQTQDAGVDWLDAPLQGRVLNRVLNFMTFNASMIARGAAQALSAFKQRYGSLGNLEDNTAQQDQLERLIWEASKAQLRLWLEASPLVQRIETQVDGQVEGLVLPKDIQGKVSKIIAQVKATRHMRGKGLWRGRRGRSMTVLFSGLSGTGKTTTAEVIARDLDLDLYRVSLAQTQSKYIGETSKHIEQILDLAQFGGVVLLFDEADALFGKRTVVEDSHDRYANSDVNVLLQGIEYFQGVAILTTNLETSIDIAFQRRFSLVVPFDMPTQAEREGIWAASLPAYTDPREGIDTDLDFPLLAQLELTGASIRKVIVQAGFNALERTEEAIITMLDIFEAAQLETENEGLTWQWNWVEGWPLPEEILERRPEANARGRLQFEIMRALKKMFTDAGIKKVTSELLTRDWRASQSETVVNLLLFHRTKKQDMSNALETKEKQRVAVHDYAFLAFIAARKDEERHFLSGVISSVIANHTNVPLERVSGADEVTIPFREGDATLLPHLSATTSFLDVPVEAPHVFVVTIPTVLPRKGEAKKKPQETVSP